ncbi:MAG: hypothetical protein V1813_00200 [Candidatus Aenigmatarchaeota archaeon]
MRKSVKGQAPVMEYIVFLFMAVLIIIALLFMVFGFQLMTTGSGAAVEAEKHSLFVMQSMLGNDITRATRYQSISVLDDAKLTALTGMDCEQFESAFGAGVWVNVTLYMEKPDCGGLGGSVFYTCREQRDLIAEMQATPCDGESYPNCGGWELCGDNKEGRMTYRSVPVNIYRKMNNTLALGVLTVGVPAEVSG